MGRAGRERDGVVGLVVSVGSTRGLVCGVVAGARGRGAGGVTGGVTGVSRCIPNAIINK
jgi:hypothetical protein